MKYVQPKDPDEDEFFVPRVIGQLPLKKFSKRERDRVFPERGVGESQEIGLYLPNRDLAVEVLQMWISGRPYFEILKPLSDAGLRIGRDHVTVEHVVDLCESAF